MENDGDGELHDRFEIHDPHDRFETCFPPCFLWVEIMENGETLHNLVAVTPC